MLSSPPVCVYVYHMLARLLDAVSVRIRSVIGDRNSQNFNFQFQLFVREPGFSDAPEDK